MLFSLAMILAAQQLALAVGLSCGLNCLAYLVSAGIFGHYYRIQVTWLFFWLLRWLFAGDPAFNPLLENIQRDGAGLQHTVVKFANVKVFI